MWRKTSRHDDEVVFENSRQQPSSIITSLSRRLWRDSWPVRVGLLRASYKTTCAVAYRGVRCRYFPSRERARRVEQRGMAGVGECKGEDVRFQL